LIEEGVEMPLRTEATTHWQPAWAGTDTGAGTAISLVNAGNYHGPLGNIGHLGGWRVDREPHPIDAMNLHLQKDGTGRPSTLGCLLVPVIYSGLLAGPGYEARFGELTTMIQQGLSRSVGSRRGTTRERAHLGKFEIVAYRIAGSLSA
jgi:hypothetical protein